MAQGTVSQEELRRRMVLRQSRQMRDAYFAWLWESWTDDFDIFDLRYLFDHEEVQEERRSLIERDDIYGENPQYFRYMLYEDDEQNIEEIPEDDEDPDAVEVLPPQGNWDEERYNVWFNMRIGFYPQYDSGIEMSDDEEEMEDQNRLARQWRYQWIPWE